MDLGLKNRVALVAASSQGIGRATAEAFAAEGCRVAMCARNSQTLQTTFEKNMASRMKCRTGTITTRG
jgi:3-oxoacyl-[acyl-carrier protein] reductase